MLMTSSYLKSTFAALALGASLLIAYGALSGEASAISVTIADLSYVVAVLLPLATFAGGLGAARSRPDLRSIIVCSAAGGVIAFLVSGFIAPWLARSFDTGPLASSHPSILESLREYRRLTAEHDAGKIVFGFVLGITGLGVFQPFAAALTATLISLCGFAVGLRTERLPNQRLAAVYNWMSGSVIVVGVAAAYSFALTIAVSHGVSPALALSVVPAPALLLLVGVAGGVHLDHQSRPISVPNAPPP